MRPLSFVKTLTLGITAVLMCIAPAIAGEPPAAAPAPAQPPAANAAEPASKPVIDPKADAIIHKMADYYKTVKSAQVSVDTAMKMEGAGQKQEMNSSTEMSVERDNKLSIQMKQNNQPGGTVVSDGKKLYMQMPGANKYAEQDAPKTMDELIESPIAALAQYSGVVLVLFSSDPYAKIMEGVTKATHMGEEEIDGVKHDRVRYEQDGIDLEVWTATGDKPIVRRIKPDMSRQLARMAEQMPQMKGAKMEGSIEVKNWKLNEAIPADRFTYTAPAGATKVGSLTALFGGGEEGPGPEVAMKGKPAPEFSLDLLGGGKASLAEHKGKNVVILDFWATWCPPCVKGLPVVTEVAKSYADKGVVFYAVNEGEDPATIEPFLKDKKLDIKVALDKDSAVGNSYGVTGIPQTVIIGKDGTIKGVHVGFSPNLKAELSKEIDEALAGKAEEKPAQSSAN
jgi:thiol-disulfide isomerase/thioredoxin